MQFVLKESHSDLVVKCQSSKLTGIFKDQSSDFKISTLQRILALHIHEIVIFHLFPRREHVALMLCQVHLSMGWRFHQVTGINASKCSCPVLPRRVANLAFSSPPAFPCPSPPVTGRLCGTDVGRGTLNASFRFPLRLPQLRTSSSFASPMKLSSDLCVLHRAETLSSHGTVLPSWKPVRGFPW